MSELRSHFDGLSWAFLVAATVALGVWLALFAWRWWLSHPRMPDAAPETPDLGEEPPAIANFLVNRWSVTRAALAATFLDLCARRAFSLQQLDRDHFVVHVGDEGRIVGSLLPYEQQLLQFVRGRATGGSCPLEVLDLGSAEAGGWWKRFSREVLRDAEKRGLARSRWSRFDWVVISGGSLVVTALFALALGEAGIGANAGNGSNEDITRLDWFLYAGGAWLLATAGFSRIRSVRDTPAGQTVCARWLGVRGYFRQSHAFDDAPAAAVILWERNLAYAAALGAAHEAVSVLPFETESPESAWSRYGGEWHEVRIRYPRRFGACQQPIKVFFIGLVTAAFWGAIAFWFLPTFTGPALDVVDTLRDDGTISDRTAFGAGVGVIAVVLGVGLYVLARFAGGVIRLWRGAADLQQERTVEGEVVKVHAGRVAIFDGRDDEVVAWTPPAMAGGFALGQRIRVRITPRLHWVKELERLDGPPADEEPAMAAASGPTIPAGPALPPLDDAVREATGLSLRRNDASGLPGVAQSFGDEGGNTVTVTSTALPGGVAGGIAAVMMRGLQRGERVDGLGTEAWFHDGTLTVREEGRAVIVRVELAQGNGDREFAVARAIATAATEAQPDTSQILSP